MHWNIGYLIKYLCIMSVLEVDSITKTYGNNKILTDIYLKCQTGDIIGLLGRNGTGKSTLLKILFGTEMSENKFIRIDGKIYDKTYLAKGEICYLPQDSFLPKQLTAIKVVELFLGKSFVELFESDELIGKVLQDKIINLSGGELRYLEIKLMLNSNSKFILLDEPFNGVSPVIIDSLKDIIKIHSHTKGIILTDHDYINVLDVATRHCLLYDGCIKNITGLDDLVKWGYLNQNDFTFLP